MTSFLKKYWPLLAGTILVIIAFRGCNNLPTHKDEKIDLDKLHNAYKSDSETLRRQISELSSKKDSLRDLLDIARRQLEVVRKDASAKIVAVKQTLSAGAEAAHRRDTAAILVNWDSLTRQVIAGLPVVVAQDSLSQQMINDCIAQGAIKDSMVVAYRYMWQKADMNYGKSYDAYNGLYKDYQQANGRLKFNKTLSRGLAMALLAAGIKIFIIK